MRRQIYLPAGTNARKEKEHGNDHEPGDLAG
jgi:hypothetical protein